MGWRVMARCTSRCLSGPVKASVPLLLWYKIFCIWKQQWRIVATSQCLYTEELWTVCQITKCTVNVAFRGGSPGALLQLMHDIMYSDTLGRKSISEKSPKSIINVMHLSIHPFNYILQAFWFADTVLWNPWPLYTSKDLFIMTCHMFVR